MASDAKIGLLLGLVFIFLIALIINGLPSFSENESNNELTASMVSLQNRPPAIAAKEREVINLRESVEKKPVQVKLPSTGNQDIHVVAEEPQVASAAKESAKVEILAAAQTVVEEDKNQKAGSSKAVFSKTYVVKEGDNLASIARKFYGPQEGNRKVNITRIFDANRKSLKSSDEIYVGQRLIIPPLPASVLDKDKIDNVLSEDRFAKVESISKQRLLKNTRRPKQISWHVVREGESLWQIAADRLGDGNRYDEIAKLNAGVLDSEDFLSVGMRLRMPSR